MNKKYECVLVVVADECVHVAIEVGISLAQQGYVNVYNYRSGILVATKSEISDEYDHTEFPLESSSTEMRIQLGELGLLQDGYPEWYNTFDVKDIYDIHR